MTKLSLLDKLRNAGTIIAAVVLTLFHRDVSSYVAAAAVLAAGLDLTITAAIHTHGSALHRIESVLGDLAGTAKSVVGALPVGSVPAAVASDVAKVADAVVPAVPVAKAKTASTAKAAAKA